MKRLSRNAAALLGSDLLRRLLGFASVTYLARIIGAEGFGAMNIGFTVLSYGIVLSSAGLASFGAREVARTGDTSVVGPVVGARVRNAVVIYCVTALLVLGLIGTGDIGMLILIFSASIFIHSVLLEWYFQGREEMGPIGMSRMLSALVYLAILLFLVHSPQDLLLVGIATIVADLVAAVMLLRMYFRRNGGFSMRLSFREWVDLDRSSLPFGIGSILGQLSLNFPVIVLGIVVSASDVGLFSAASKIVFFLLMSDRLLATLLLPASSRIHAARPGELAPVLLTARKWVLIISLPMCVGGTILADRLMTGLFGEGFLQSGNLFSIAVWFVPLTLLHTVYTSGLLAAGREKSYARVMIISAGVYAATTIAGVIALGVTGAALAIVVSELATLLLMQRQCNEVVRLPFDRGVALTALSVLLMGATVMAFSSLHLGILIPSAAILYGTLLFVMKGVSMQEFEELMGRFR